MDYICNDRYILVVEFKSSLKSCMVNSFYQKLKLKYIPSIEGCKHFTLILKIVKIPLKENYHVISSF